MNNNKNNPQITFLTESEALSLKEFGEHYTKAPLSDFSIVLGASVDDSQTCDSYDSNDRPGKYWTQTYRTTDGVTVINYVGNKENVCCKYRGAAGRPVLIFEEDSFIPYTNKKDTKNEIQYGEYPQTIADTSINLLLTGKLEETGKIYTVDSKKYDEYKEEFCPIELTEYEYDGQKYVKATVNPDEDKDFVILSDGNKYKKGEEVWIKVEPITWIEKEKNKYLSKKCLFAGIRFDKKDKPYYDFKFKDTEINYFLQVHFVKNIIPKNHIKGIEYKTINNFIYVDKDGNKKRNIKISVKIKK